MNLRACVAEFIGTFTLIFIGVGVIAGSMLNSVSTGLTGIALAHGLAIAVMVSATAAISGGHLNPAVTLGIWLAGKIKTLDAVGYWLFQCAGAIAASAIANKVFDMTALQSSKFGMPALSAGVEPIFGIVVEALLTFFLVFVVFGTAVDKKAPKVGGLFIGLTITMGILAGGPVTGAAINPARWLGPAVNGGGYENAIVYIAGPLIGAAVAALLYQNVLMEKEPAPEEA